MVGLKFPQKVSNFTEKIIIFPPQKMFMGFTCSNMPLIIRKIYKLYNIFIFSSKFFGLNWKKNNKKFLQYRVTELPKS